jgi:hypothetical protein
MPRHHHYQRVSQIADGETAAATSNQSYLNQLRTGANGVGDAVGSRVTNATGSSRLGGYAGGYVQGKINSAVNSAVDAGVDVAAQHIANTFIKTDPEAPTKTYSDHYRLAMTKYENEQGGALDGFTVDQDLSSNEFTTYLDSKGKAHISYRATDLNDPNTRLADLKQDYFIASGSSGKTNRGKRAVDVAQRAIAKYGKENVDLVGYSLGGNSAMLASSATGLNAEVYNPGFTPQQAQNQKKHHSYGKFLDKVGRWAERVGNFGLNHDGPQDYSHVIVNANAGDIVSSGVSMAPKGTFQEVNIDSNPVKKQGKTHLANAAADAIVGAGEAGVGAEGLALDQVIKVGEQIGEAALDVHGTSNWTNERQAAIRAARNGPPKAPKQPDMQWNVQDQTPQISHEGGTPLPDTRSANVLDQQQYESYIQKLHTTGAVGRKPPDNSPVQQPGRVDRFPGGSLATDPGATSARPESAADATAVAPPQPEVPASTNNAVASNTANPLPAVTASAPPAPQPSNVQGHNQQAAGNGGWQSGVTAPSPAVYAPPEQIGGGQNVRATQFMPNQTTSTARRQGRKSRVSHRRHSTHAAGHHKRK